MAERRNPVLMGNGMGAGMDDSAPVRGPRVTGGSLYGGDPNYPQANPRHPRDPFAVTDKLIMNGLPGDYEALREELMARAMENGTYSPASAGAGAPRGGYHPIFGVPLYQPEAQQQAAPAQQSLPPSNDPAAVPDIYGSSEGDAWSNYMNLAREQTTGLNQMPGVFSEYESVPADDAAASAMFHEGSQVPDYWNAVISQTLRPPRRQRPGQMGGMGTGGYGTGQY